MCGLILAPNTFPRESVERAMVAMGHRATDGYSGLAHFRGWHLGQVRLAVQTDGYTGQQPFRRGEEAMAFVGEIFSPFPESDELWNALTGTCSQAMMLDGFWSVVRINETGYATAFTDHLGIKPLYFWEEKGIVCSEIAPMFQLTAPPDFDPVYLANCIKFGYDHSGRTPWLGIRQLAPGTALRLGAQPTLTPRLFQYWDWDRVPHANPTPGAVRELLSSTIIRWAKGSKRPVGLLLSGGLDSSIVYYVLKAAEVPFTPYTIENGEDEYLPDDPDIFRLTIADYPTYPEAAHIMEAPLDLGSVFPQIALSRALAGEKLHVALSGDGADELFGGYRRARIYDSQKSDVFCELPYYHLPRLDRVMMRNTIELRSPFLSPAVVATALRVPYEWRTHKQLLKLAFKGIVPDKILAREKHPLKSKEVLNDQVGHRIKLLESFYDVFRRVYPTPEPLLASRVVEQPREAV